MHQSVDFCVKNALKLTFEHIQVKNFFRLAGARHEGRKKEGKGQRGAGGMGEGGDGRKRKGRGDDGKGQEGVKLRKTL